MNDPISRKEYQENNIIFMKEIESIKKNINNINIHIAKLPEKIIKRMDDKYVSKDSFRPVQKVVYGLVGAILLGVIVAILALIIK